jgi:hypothetical protein
VLVIGAQPPDRARLEARGVHFTAPGFGRPSCARGVLRVNRGRASVRIRIGLAATKSWAFDAVLEEPSGEIDAALPAGEIDVVLCARESDACRPGGRTLVEQRITLVAGGTFREVIEGP